jgi:hypothetical protein
LACPDWVEAFGNLGRLRLDRNLLAWQIASRFPPVQFAQVHNISQLLSSGRLPKQIIKNIAVAWMGARLALARGNGTRIPRYVGNKNVAHKLYFVELLPIVFARVCQQYLLINLTRSRGIPAIEGLIYCFVCNPQKPRLLPAACAEAVPERRRRSFVAFDNSYILWRNLKNNLWAE